MTNEEALDSLRALDKHFKERFPGNGYLAVGWAIQEIERLRSLVQDIRPILEQDIECALAMGPPDGPCSCGDCEWYDRSLAWKARIDAGELDV